MIVIQSNIEISRSPMKYLPLLLVITTLLIGCGHKKTSTQALSHRSQSDVLSYLETYQPSVRTDGHQTSFNEFISELGDEKVVYVGERHDRYEHHLNQLAVLQALHAKNPNLSIAVEWLQDPFQSVVDNYLSGTLNETEFLSKSEYHNRWGYDFRMLRPIFEFARNNQLPVIALNADVTITKKISQLGLAGLEESDRAKLPETITLPPEAEMAQLKKIFDMHPAEGRNFDNFVTVQRIWDITMAENIVEYLNQHPERQIVVFAGDGHLKKGQAIPAEVSKLKPELTTSVVHSAVENFEAKNESDYLVLSLAQSLPAIGKMGVWLGDHEKGTLALSVIAESAAAEAGMENGDVITSLGGTETAASGGLKMAISAYEPGDKVKVSVLRFSDTDKAEALELTITLR